MADELSFDITSHGDSSGFDKMARKAQETALKIEAANLKVEKATKKATEADAKYEKGSLQAREAANKLAGAQLGLSKALSSTDKTVEDTREKIEKLDVATKKSDDSSNRLSTTMKKVGGALATAGFGAAKSVGTFAGLASVGVTAGVAIGKLAVATAHLAASVGPAAAALLPLAAGVLLVKATIGAALPAIGAQLSPITAEWNKQTAAVGKLASAGLKPLAQEFTKANFPQIGAAMQSIATSTNGAVKSFLAWTASTPGVKAIGEITAGTAHQFKYLAPLVSDVAQSLVALAGRASGAAFIAFGDGADRALRKMTAFLDGISRSDIYDAFDKLGSIGQKAGAGFRAIGDGIAYLGQHEKEILLVRNAMAALAVVVGVATGGWLAALGGAITLVALHWNDLVAAFSSVSGWVTSLGAKFPSLTESTEAAGGAAGRIKEAFMGFVDDVKPHLQPFLDHLGDAFIRLQPYISGLITVTGALIAIFLKIAGPIIGAYLDSLGLLIDGYSKVVLAVTKMASAVLNRFADLVAPIASVARKLHLPFAKELQGVVDDSRRAAKRITDNVSKVNADLAVREIERLQKKVNSLKGKKVKTEADKAAIATSEARIRTLQSKINGLHGKTVRIGFSFYQIGKGPGSYGQGLGVLAKAAGGPVIGPGTATSDSILTRLSNGEHVISAAEVKKLGGHAAIERLRKGAASQTHASVTAPTGVTSGGGGVAIQISSGGSEMDDLIVQIIRKAVRVKGGGNVQTALGRS